MELIRLKELTELTELADKNNSLNEGVGANLAAFLASKLHVASKELPKAIREYALDLRIDKIRNLFRDGVTLKPTKNGGKTSLTTVIKSKSKEFKLASALFEYGLSQRNIKDQVSDALKASFMRTFHFTDVTIDEINVFSSPVSFSLRIEYDIDDSNSSDDLTSKANLNIYTNFINRMLPVIIGKVFGNSEIKSMLSNISSKNPVSKEIERVETRAKEKLEAEGRY